MNGSINAFSFKKECILNCYKCQAFMGTVPTKCNSIQHIWAAYIVHINSYLKKIFECNFFFHSLRHQRFLLRGALLILWERIRFNRERRRYVLYELHQTVLGMGQLKKYLFNGISNIFYSFQMDHFRTTKILLNLNYSIKTYFY